MSPVTEALPVVSRPVTPIRRVRRRGAPWSLLGAPVKRGDLALATALPGTHLRRGEPGAVATSELHHLQLESGHRRRAAHLDASPRFIPEWVEVDLADALDRHGRAMIVPPDLDPSGLGW